MIGVLSQITTYRGVDSLSTCLNHSHRKPAPATALHRAALTPGTPLPVSSLLGASPSTLQNCPDYWDKTSLELESALCHDGDWHPSEFVARCESARRTGSSASELRRIQVDEISTLLVWCAVKAGCKELSL
jgi:hypothetical protein